MVRRSACQEICKDRGKAWEILMKMVAYGARNMLAREREERAKRN